MATFRTKTEKVYVQLQNEIIEGGLEPGSRLIISQLAKQFGVSEIPIREAIQRLDQEGYVVLRPHSGAVVSSLSEQDIRQIFEIRINLESFAARLAVDYLSNHDLHDLEAILDQSIACYHGNYLSEYPKLNRAFHESIYQHSNNPRLASMISDLWNLSKRYPNLFHNRKAIELSIEEHRQIFEALKKRDADLAEQLTKEHKTRGYQDLIRIVRKMNEFKEELTP